VDVSALSNASLFSLLGIIITAAPMVAGFAFAWRPTASRFALVRALTLVGVFETCAVLLLGAVNHLIYLAQQPPAAPAPPGDVYMSAAEILVIPFIGFSFLTVAWVGVAVGLRKPFDT
jgi:hypothetical protein